MQIREADKADLPFITEVYNEAVASRISTADTSAVDMSCFEDRILKPDPSRPLWILTEHGERIGWASFRDFYGRPAYSGTAEISIYILSRFQRKGFGTIVLDKMISSCSSLGIDTLLAYVFSHNKASLDLFYRSGFELWGQLPDVAVIDGKKQSLSILGKKINQNINQ